MPPKKWKDTTARESGIVHRENADLNAGFEVVGHQCQYFQDGREGSDRWGTSYKNKWACGTGWGAGEYVCPAYVEESCPGCKNPGNRLDPCLNQSCNNVCGSCGGGGRSVTIAYCGQEKSLFNGSSHSEMNGTLRCDQWTSTPEENDLVFPVNWFPVIEQDRNDKTTGKKADRVNTGETWMSELGEYPVIGTTLKTVYESVFSSKRRLLREKLGISDKPTLMVNGLVLDATLDEIWDDRHDVLDYCMESGVNVMIPPQYSAYTDLQNYMAVYNANRTFQWYCEARERGFDHVALQHIGPQSPWLLQEFFDFAARSGTKLVSINMQLAHSEKGGLDMRGIKRLRDCDEGYPDDCKFIVFGLSTYPRIAQAANVLKKREVIYANVNAYASSVFFGTYPSGTRAKAGMTKGQVFAHNCKWFAEHTDKALGMAKKK